MAPSTGVASTVSGGSWMSTTAQNAALHLVREGEVDGDRLIVRGGSAGGYTTLASLTFRDVFKVGASYYGISDLEALARDTHKFESRYLDSLIGPYPERRDLYVERSPIHHTDRLSCPIILMQGLEDEVVPPNQAEVMVEALRNKGLPLAYLAFEGEQHGFRKSENVVRSLEAEMYFYSPHPRLRPSRRGRAGGDRKTFTKSAQLRHHAREGRNPRPQRRGKMPQVAR